jgi:hypothetical protein
MKSTLLLSINQLAERARRLVVVHAIALVLLCVLSSAMLLAIADYLLHFQDYGIRWLQFTTLLLVTAGAWLRFLRPALQCRFDPVTTARRLESRFPQLGQRLSSAVAFLAESGGELTSPLQQALVKQVESELVEMNIEACLLSHRTRQAVICFGVLVAVVAGCVSWQPSDSLLAAGRLVQPWREASWPRRHRLRLEAPPLRVARGAHFLVTLVDDGKRLPRTVLFEVLHEGDTETSRYESQVTGKRFEFRLEQVTRSFQVRASGGDDLAMAWHRVDVIEPPQLQSTLLTLHSPAYTARGPEVFIGDARLIAGSWLDLEVEVNRPVDQVVLVFEQHGGESREFLQGVDGGRRFELAPDRSAPWVVVESGRYWFELQGDVLARSRSWSLDVITDQPPSVTIETPRDGQVFWPRAIVPIVAGLRDDIRIRDVELHFRLRPGDEQGDQMVVIDQGPELTVDADSRSFEDFFSGDHRQLLFAWDLGRQQGIEAGKLVEFELVVTDYLGNIARSSPQQLKLVDRQQLIQQLVRDHVQISDAIHELAAKQRLLREQTSRLRAQLPGELSGRDVARQLQQLLLQQQQVIEKLAGQPAGVLLAAKQLQRAAIANRLHGVDIATLANSLHDSLEFVASDLLPQAKQHVAASWKLADANQQDSVTKDETWQQVAALLDQALGFQDSVASELEELAGSGKRGNHFRSLLVQFHQAQEDQQRLLEETRQLQLERLSSNDNQRQLPGSGEIQSLVDRQQQLGEQLDRLQRQLRTTVEDKLTAPSHRDTASQALQTSRQATLSGLFLALPELLRDQQLGEAIESMDAVSLVLGSIVDILSNRYTRQLEGTVAGVPGLLEQLKDLEIQQLELVKQLQAAGKETDLQVRKSLQMDLADRQSAVGTQLHVLTSAVQQTGKMVVADQLSLALSAAALASLDCNAGLFNEAANQAEKVAMAIHRSRELLKQLDRSARSRIALRSLDQLEPKLEDIRRRQQELLEETRELGKSLEQQPAGRLSRSERITLSGLARRQHRLKVELEKSARTLDDVSIFRFALETVATAMGEVTGLLETEQVGEDCQQLQQQLLDRLDQVRTGLADVLASSPPDSNLNPPAGVSNELAAILQSPAELRLLVSMQQRILEGTRLLDRARQRFAELTPRQKKQQRELIRQQAELIRLLARIRNPVPHAEAEGGQQ